MELPADVRDALNAAWRRDVAEKSIERWLGLCESEGWGRIPEDMALLVRIFGASWYFTRFIFVNGPDMVRLVDEDSPADLSTQAWLEVFREVYSIEGLESRVDRLRVLKNRIMLQILIAYLRQDCSMEQTEYALTCLAEATMQVVTRLFLLAPDDTDHPVTVLGMGRMAGHEMTFGSDLDVIFLYAGESSDMDVELERRIRLLLRHIAMQTPAGSLYDMDMRLRPHGNAGVLVTTFRSFMDYHGADREIWERQLMTRCRPVANLTDEVHTLMEDVNSHIFGKYDIDILKSGIADMRQRVEKELGRPTGKYEVKRGRGGIMDIDFITHYFQLAYGHEQRGLRTGSTRAVLRLIDESGLLADNTGGRLLDSYDFLKRVEMSLRLFDMKPISTFPFDEEANISLARAMGFGESGSRAFVDHYRTVTDDVRDIFNSIMNAESV
ncbi:MAG: hypothetical protein WD750_09465 [Gammaproteobacteria bacterium]